MPSGVLVKFLEPFGPSSWEGEPWPPLSLCCLLFYFLQPWPGSVQSPRRACCPFSRAKCWLAEFCSWSCFFNKETASRFTHTPPFFGSPHKCQNCLQNSNYKVNTTGKRGNRLLPKPCPDYGFFKHEAFNKASACRISFPSDQTLPHGFRTPSPWLRAAACRG